MALIDFRDHSPIAGHVERDFSNSCAAVKKISTDVVPRTAVLQHLSTKCLR